MTEENKKYLKEYTEKITEYVDYLINNKTSRKLTSTFKYKSINFHIHNYCGGISSHDDIVRFIQRYVAYLCSHYIDMGTGEHVVPEFLNDNIGEEIDVFFIYDSVTDRCIVVIENELHFDFHPMSPHKLMALKEPEHYIAESFFSYYYSYNIEHLTGLELIRFEPPYEW